MTKTHAEMREPRVRRRLSRILKEVKTECGDSDASSDDDGQSAFFFFTIIADNYTFLISKAFLEFKSCGH